MSRNKARAGYAWVLEFWDSVAWNIGSGQYEYKAEAIAECNKRNRETPHDARQGAFDGHRWRVRERMVRL